MLIQVDVDSTLYASDVLFNQVAKDFGVDWPVRYYTWFKAEEIGTDLETLLSIFKTAHDKPYALTNTPYPDAVDVLRGLAEDYPEAEIAYVSDRNEQLGEVLREWLIQEGFLHDENQYVAATKDKREWMRTAQPDVVIDDRVRTMLMARYELGAQVVSLQHDYNQSLKGEADGIYIVPTWKDIDQVLRATVLPAVRSKGRRYDLELV